MCKVKISNLEIFGFHGVYSYEKEQGQNFYLDIEYLPEKYINSINDDIDDVIDYMDFISTIINLFNKKRYSLIETLVKEMIDQIVLIYNLRYVKLVIKKKIILENNNIDFISVEVEKNNE